MVLSSRYTSAPIPDISLATFFRDAVAPRAGDVAVLDGPTGRSYTFRQVLDLSASVPTRLVLRWSAAVASGLVARGTAPANRVAFIVPSLPEVALACHGAIAAGAVAM